MKKELKHMNPERLVAMDDPITVQNCYNIPPECVVPVRRALVERGRAIIRAADMVHYSVDVESFGALGKGDMAAIGIVSSEGAEGYWEVQPYSRRRDPDTETWTRESAGLDYAEFARGQRGQPVLEVMDELSAWTRKESHRTNKQALFVAYGAPFDWGMFCDALSHANQARPAQPLHNPFGYEAVNYEDHFLGITGTMDRSATSADRLPAVLRPEQPLTHHALRDARVQLATHYVVAGLVAHRDVARLRLPSITVASAMAQM